MQIPERSPGYLWEDPLGTRLSRRTTATRRHSCDHVKFCLFKDYLTTTFKSHIESYEYHIYKKKKQCEIKLPQRFILTEPDCSVCSVRARNQTGTRLRRGQTHKGRSSGPAAVEEAPAIDPCIPQPATRKEKKRQCRKRTASSTKEEMNKRKKSDSVKKGRCPRPGLSKPPFLIFYLFCFKGQLIVLWVICSHL